MRGVAERGRKLLPPAVRKRIPRMDETAQVRDPWVYAKFFYPDYSWSWYVIEFDGEDLFYGFVDGDYPELGYFRLSELLSARGKLSLSIERDEWFTPCPLSEVMERVKRGH